MFFRDKFIAEICDCVTKIIISKFSYQKSCNPVLALLPPTLSLSLSLFLPLSLI